MKNKPSSDKSVLLIEDFKIDINATLPLLVDAGYQQANIHVSENLDDAEKHLAKYKPELVILDLEIPQNGNTIRIPEKDLRRGLSFLRSLIERYDNQLRIVAYSRYPNSWVVYQVISQGISFIAKQDYNKDFFPLAIQQIKQGHIIVSSSVIPNLRQIFRLALRVGLDDEDKQILRYIIAGTSDKDIANAMGYGEDWVASRLRRMFKSFGFKNRDDLAVWFRDYIAPIYGIDTEITKS